MVMNSNDRDCKAWCVGASARGDMGGSFGRFAFQAGYRRNRLDRGGGSNLHQALYRAVGSSLELAKFSKYLACVCYVLGVVEMTS